VNERKAMNGDTSSQLKGTTTDEINAELQAEIEAMQSDDLGEDDANGIDNEFNQ
jgi:hypothetical protein